MDFRLDAKRRRYVKELEEAAASTLSLKGREKMLDAVKDYYKSRDVEKFVYRISALLDSPDKMNLLKKIRRIVPPMHINVFDVMAPYHKMATPLKPASHSGTPSGVAPNNPAYWVHQQQQEEIQRLRYQLRVMASHVPSAAPRTKGRRQKRMPLPKSMQSNGALKVERLFDDPNAISNGFHSENADDIDERLGKSTSAATTPRSRASATSASADELKVVFVPPDAEGEMGFTVRGGVEHGIGIFVKDVDRGSLADLNGLRRGDEILEANEESLAGVSITRAHRLLGGADGNGVERTASSSPAAPLKLVVRRRRRGEEGTPVKERLSWFLSSTESLEAGEVETLRTGPKRALLRALASSSSTPLLNRSLDSSSTTPLPDREEVLLRIPKPSSTTRLGFNVRGGSEYGVGVFVSQVDPNGLAQRHGLRVGDQILSVGERRCEWASHAEAVAIVKGALRRSGGGGADAVNSDDEVSVEILVRRLGKYPAFKEVLSKTAGVSKFLSDSAADAKLRRRPASSTEATPMRRAASTPDVGGESKVAVDVHAVQDRVTPEVTPVATPNRRARGGDTIGAGDAENEEHGVEDMTTADLKYLAMMKNAIKRTTRRKKKEKTREQPEFENDKKAENERRRGASRNSSARSEKQQKSNERIQDSNWSRSSPNKNGSANRNFLVKAMGVGGLLSRPPRKVIMDPVADNKGKFVLQTVGRPADADAATAAAASASEAIDASERLEPPAKSAETTQNGSSTPPVEDAGLAELMRLEERKKEIKRSAREVRSGRGRGKGGRGRGGSKRDADPVVNGVARLESFELQDPLADFLQMNSNPQREVDGVADQPASSSASVRVIDGVTLPEPPQLSPPPTPPTTPPPTTPPPAEEDYGVTTPKQAMLEEDADERVGTGSSTRDLELHPVQRTRPPVDLRTCIAIKSSPDNDAVSQIPSPPSPSHVASPEARPSSRAPSPTPSPNYSQHPRSTPAASPKPRRSPVPSPSRRPDPRPPPKPPRSPMTASPNRRPTSSPHPDRRSTPTPSPNRRPTPAPSPTPLPPSASSSTSSSGAENVRVTSGAYITASPAPSRGNDSGRPIPSASPPSTSSASGAGKMAPKKSLLLRLADKQGKRRRERRKGNEQTAANCVNDKEDDGGRRYDDGARPVPTTLRLTTRRGDVDDDDDDDDDDDTVEVFLERGHSRLGISVSGGKDNKLQPEVRLAQIYADGAASGIRELKVGMRILSVDEQSLESSTHLQAVNLIRKAYHTKSSARMKLKLEKPK